MNEAKPKRCVDPVIKFCQGCPWGHITYPAWVETAEDLEWCTIESTCILGYDQGRPEDEPTEEELREFDEMCRQAEEFSRRENNENVIEWWDEL
jgi:hypothetical protein